MPDADSIYAALRSAITDSSADSGPDGPTSFDKGKVAGFIVGADEVAEATVEAYRKLGISPVFMMARESRPLYLLINKYRDVDIQGLRSVGMAQRELDDLTAKGIVLAVGATAIPTPAADFPSQQIIYDIATTLLNHAAAAEASSTSDGPSNDHLVLPGKPVFLDLVDEPNSDVLAKAAEEKGWAVSRGA